MRTAHDAPSSPESSHILIALVSAKKSTSARSFATHEDASEQGMRPGALRSGGVAQGRKPARHPIRVGSGPI
eukprot:365660-Chlamydomonas_euryale.AAC.15